ncbi:MAG TPA: peptide-binding protein [Thermomicrobiaceae bacterium]|nr:peptide-binding protein [Thermomicrobiaceae bacterium]
MDEGLSPKRAVESLLDAGLSRRALLRRSAFGLGLTVVGGLLAACGGSTASPTTSTTSSGGSTATTSSSGGASTPAAAGTGPTATTGSAVATPGGVAESAFKIEPAAKKGGQIIEASTSDAKTANPILSTDTTSGRIIRLMFNIMVTPDPQTTSPAPELASKWDISSDGLTYTFTLQSGVKWHDGQPLTSADVKFTYDTMLNPKSNSPRTSVLADRIKSIATPDDTTAVFTLKKPASPFLLSNMYGIIPQHILSSVDPAQLAQNPFSTGKKGVTVGTGPFMFDSWVKNDHVQMVKNPNYWRGAPNIDTYILKIVPNTTAANQQLKTGEVDWLQVVDPSAMADLQKQSNLNVAVYDTFSFTFYTYQLDASKTTLFQDKAVRQALLYALDRQAMVQAIYFGQALVAVGTMPKLSWAYDPSAITNKYPFDLNKAKQLLSDAGWKAGPDGILAKNGQKLKFTGYSSSASNTFEQLMTVFQQSWKQIGVDCTPNFEEWNAFLNRITGTHDFDIFLVGFVWGVDPDQTTMWDSTAYKGGFNMGKYSNAQVDQLLAQGLATTDQKQRTQIYAQMQNILMDDLPEAILFFPKGITAVNKRVHNLIPNAVDIPFDAEKWWVS